jgi:glutamate/tyrosine decarboxylase-like PLP-dependent enzyme
VELELNPQVRAELWKQLEKIVEQYARDIGSRRVTPELNPDLLRERLRAFTFNEPVAPAAAVDFAASHLAEFQTHTPHPRYYGLFNPNPTAMGIFADTLVAAFNPQLAAWSHSPFAIEVENHLIRALGGRFGYDPQSTDGAFCAGGAEANHSAVLCALTNAFPDFNARGVRALPAQPVFYASTECHHSFHKAARLCGIGRESLREIPADDALRMRPDVLAQAIAEDRARGLAPFMVIATAGTTNAAAVDPIVEAGAIARREELWFHVDAAWGGAAALAPSLAPLLAGMGEADSITFDAHKWLSVPMGAGIFLTRHKDILTRTFATHTAYMPKEAAGLDVIDPHLHSIQWSRRFTGLKVFLSLAVAGWEGYAAAVERMAAMGNLMRRELAARNWEIVYRSELPVVCFLDKGGADPREIAMRVVASGEAWISTTLLRGRELVLRACITNYRTRESDIRALADTLDRARNTRKIG